MQHSAPHHLNMYQQSRAQLKSIQLFSAGILDPQAVRYPTSDADHEPAARIRTMQESFQELRSERLQITRRPAM